MRDNRATASSTGADFVVSVAGGIDHDGSLVLSDSTVDRNQAAQLPLATGATALAGGAMDIDGLATIRDSRFIGNNGAAPSLTLTDSTITANALSPSTGVVAQGGGLFTAFPATLTTTRTVIEGNRTDQCFGC